MSNDQKVSPRVTASDHNNPPSHLTGRAYWRSLEEYADSEGFRERLGYAGAPIDEDQLTGLSRRRFIQVMAASMSLAGLTLSGCRRWPEEKIAPYAARPEGRTPGEPVYYATMFEQAGVATGVLAESFDGRPIKIEGNPRHPGSQGATDVWSQASILALYDPDRARSPRQKADGGQQRRGWNNFNAFASNHFGGRRGSDGSKIAVLAEPTSGPTMRAMRRRFEQAFPGAQWYEWSPVNRDHANAGLKQAFGQPLREQLHLDQANVIACFDADPLGRHPNGVRHERDWAKGRRSADEQNPRMSRVYAAEPTFTRIGAVADERLPVRASHVPGLIAALAARLGVTGTGGNANGASRFIEMLAADLARPENRGKSLILVGEDQPAETHALAWAINEHLGNLGTTVSFIEDPAGDAPAMGDQLAELAERMQGDEIDTLLILGGNPVYDAPADVDFAAALDRLDATIHLSEYVNETSAACDWHLPQAHYLESWGDGRAWDGTLSVQQPMILPLYNGKTPAELLATLADDNVTDGYGLVRRTFKEQNLLSSVDFKNAWRAVLHHGVVEGSAASAVTPAVRADARNAAAPSAISAEYELAFLPDAKLYDGRWANNGWLQELPDAVTHLTWDNAALVSVTDANKLGVKTGDTLQLTVAGRELTMPALPTPGQAEGAITVALGYGRSVAGNIGHEIGFDTYKLRTRDGMHVAPVQVAAAGGHHKLATTTEHDLIDAVGQAAVKYRVGDKDGSGYIIKSASFADYQRNPDVIQKNIHGEVALPLYNPPVNEQWNEPAWDGAPEAFNKPHAWGMAIDMSACTGCNSCVIACQSENNVPVVGKEQVLVNREMHWLRIDRYFRGKPDNPEVVHQPMMCVHCENAPCEQVCPVNASLHDSEGLNLQVYNRCIGTRYCSNNCPYKVRRFNFFDYHAQDPRGTGIPGLAAKPWLKIPDQEQGESIDEIKKMIFNPDVTVRMRGVMEKCTYCTQRIARAKIDAKNAYAKGERAEPTVKDGEVVTACQSACPTEAIVFGDLNDPNSRVSQLHRNPRAYQVLQPELNTRPRTEHLAKIRNPATEVAGS